jgi:hypothetical protein
MDRWQIHWPASRGILNLSCCQRPCLNQRLQTTQLNFEEPLSNKIEMIDQGNSKSFNANTALVLKTMNKEDQYSHLIPLDEIMCPFSPYCCHTTQTMVIKAGKNNQICWDRSTTIKPTNIVMNQVTPVLREAPITFSHVKMQLYTDIQYSHQLVPNIHNTSGYGGCKGLLLFPSHTC